MNKTSLLWKLSGERLPGPSYLFGTMHVRDQRAFLRLGRVYAAIEECNGFAAEFHLESTGELLQATAIQLPDNQRLSDFLPKKRFEKYRAILLKSTGLDLQQFDQVLPFMTVNLVTEQLLGRDMPEPLDQHLWAFAKKSEKSLHGIETLQEQMEVLRKITFDEQLKMLNGLCSNIAKFRQYLVRLAELYEASEVQALYKMVKKNSKSLRPLMIYERNQIMANRITTLMQERRMFLAIGAAHLGGGKGVLRLLKNQGFKLTPIQMAE